MGLHEPSLVKKITHLAGTAKCTSRYPQNRSQPQVSVFFNLFYLLGFELLGNCCPSSVKALKKKMLSLKGPHPFSYIRFFFFIPAFYWNCCFVLSSKVFCFPVLDILFVFQYWRFFSSYQTRKSLFRCGNKCQCINWHQKGLCFIVRTFWNAESRTFLISWHFADRQIFRWENDDFTFLKL